MISSSINSKVTRRFGTISFLFFGCLTTVSIWQQHEIMTWVFGSLCFLGFLLLLMPKRLSFLHRWWLIAGRFIGTVITTVLMTLAFYLIITPAAFLKRIFGGRPIRLKPDKARSSYWVDRAEPAQPRERFPKRY